MEPGEGPGWDLSPPAKQAFYNENAHGQPAKSRAASAQADAEKNKKKETWDWRHSPGFKSCLYHLLHIWSWASHFTEPQISPLKRDIIILFWKGLLISVIIRDK